MTEEKIDKVTLPASLEDGVCFVDKSFFENFTCNKCHKWLEMQNLKDFTVHKRWDLSLFIVAFVVVLLH